MKTATVETVIQKLESVMAVRKDIRETIVIQNAQQTVLRNVNKMDNVFLAMGIFMAISVISPVQNFAKVNVYSPMANVPSARMDIMETNAVTNVLMHARMFVIINPDTVTVNRVSMERNVTIRVQKTVRPWSVTKPAGNASVDVRITGSMV